MKGKGGAEKEIKNRSGRGNESVVGPKRSMEERKILKEIKIRMFECMCLPSVLYGFEKKFQCL